MSMTHERAFIVASDGAKTRRTLLQLFLALLEAVSLGDDTLEHFSEGIPDTPMN